MIVGYRLLYKVNFVREEVFLVLLVRREYWVLGGLEICLWLY